MPTGVYIRTDKHRAALKNKGQGVYVRTEENKQHLKHTWQDPEIRALRIVNMLITNAKSKTKLKRAIAQKDAQNRPEIKEANQTAQKKYWKNLDDFTYLEYCAQNKEIANRPEVVLNKSLKQRLSIIKRIERIGPCCPNFNIKACKTFEMFDDIEDTKGLYGNKEFKIKELGYFVDYINFDKKIIIEWDELKLHYKKDGMLRNKDIRRQKEIQELYPDFEFIRIKEGVIKRDNGSKL